MSLDSRLRAALAPDNNPIDVHAELAEVLAGVDMSPADAGGTVTFRGADPIVPSTLRLASAAGIGLVAKSVAMAKLWRARGGEGQDISMDLRKAPHRLCPFYDFTWEKLNGFPPGVPSDPGNPMALSFYRAGDGRWVMPLNAYPQLKQRALELLDCADNTAAVTRAVAGWKAAELEQAGTEAGVVMPMLRTLEEFLAEPQYRDFLAHQPLVEVEKIADGAPQPLPEGAGSPLDGIRALGMGHVIAGAGIGRTMALHGADVLNLWKPYEHENDILYYTANVGVRSSLVDPHSPAGAQQVRDLLRDADVFYANRRPGYLEKIGLSPEQAAGIRPGIIHTTVSLFGTGGPWADRVGFDQSAGCVTGMMSLEGAEDQPQLSPIAVVNDYLVSWLATAGIVQALLRRADEGGSYRVHVSLTRVALWILSLGTFDQGYARATAGSGGEHGYLAPDTFTAETPCGSYQGVTDQVEMSATPGEYRTVLVPRGSSRAEWLSRG